MPMTDESTTRYLACRVEPGLFKEEWLVYLDVGTLHDPERTVRAQLLADKREVKEVVGPPARNSPAPAWLRVEQADVKGDFAIVVLPQPAEPVGATVVVKQERLRREIGP
jgi:hypothetical protein